MLSRKPVHSWIKSKDIGFMHCKQPFCNADVCSLTLVRISSNCKLQDATDNENAVSIKL